MSELEEISQIVEFSFNSKLDQFVIRFLNNNTYILKIEDLPKKLQTRKPDWENAVLSPSKGSLIVEAGKELRQVPFHTIHSRGKQI